MHIVRKLLIALTLVLAALSCKREEISGGGNPSARPYNFAKLMDAVQSGLWYEKAEDCGDYLAVFFDGGTVVNVPFDEVKTIDGNIFDEPTIARNREGTRWLNNLVDTGLFVETAADSESYPLYKNISLQRFRDSPRVRPEKGFQDVLIPCQRQPRPFRRHSLHHQ